MPRAPHPHTAGPHASAEHRRRASNRQQRSGTPTPPARPPLPCPPSPPSQVPCLSIPCVIVANVLLIRSLSSFSAALRPLNDLLAAVARAALGLREAAVDGTPTDSWFALALIIVAQMGTHAVVAGVLDAVRQVHPCAGGGTGSGALCVRSRPLQTSALRCAVERSGCALSCR